MKKRSSLVPDKKALTAGLTAVFGGNGCGGGHVTILARKRANERCTFPSDVVTCRLADGTVLRLFCKYGVGGVQSDSENLGGVRYEVGVYQYVLQPLRASTPTFYGVYMDANTGNAWLILEYLAKSVTLGEMPDPTVVLAARWIARFHAASEARLTSTRMPFMTTYDAEYYLGWASRTAAFAGRWHRRFPWLSTVCRRFEEVVNLLVSSPPTVIHGEYYPRNILVQNGAIRPVDWETAAIGAGVIDLAFLTEGFAKNVVRQCEVEYQRARWPHSPPSDFMRSLTVARLYGQFRWLGDRPEWTTHRDSLEGFEQLRLEAERLGII